MPSVAITLSNWMDPWRDFASGSPLNESSFLEGKSMSPPLHPAFLRLISIVRAAALCPGPRRPLSRTVAHSTHLACAWSLVVFGFTWSRSHCLAAASLLRPPAWSRLFLRFLRRSFVFSFADISWNGQHCKGCQISLDTLFFPYLGRLAAMKCSGIISLTFMSPENSFYFLTAWISSHPLCVRVHTAFISNLHTPQLLQ